MNSLKNILILIPVFFSYLTVTQAQSEKNKTLLAPGLDLKKEISMAEKHNYSIRLENGMAVIGNVIQQGIDLTIDIYNPQGLLIKQIDSPNGINGDEIIDFTSSSSGNYNFVIHTSEDDIEKGEYVLKIDKVLSLTENIKRITKKELPTQTLYKLWESSLTDKDAVNQFITQHTERHIIEPIEGDADHMLITYFCIPDKNTEYIMLSGGPDFLGLRFQRLPNTELFFVTQRVPKDARFNYGFNYFNLDKAGPENEILSRSVQHAYDGIVEMPDAPKQSYINEREGIDKGLLLPTLITSQILEEERKITVHTPANYDAKRPHNLLIIFDGEAYGARPNRRARIPAPVIMDNLLADHKIPPTITILVWSMGRRSKDLISDKFADFIAKELIPWARSHYKINSGSDKVILGGSSRGGFAASYIALKHPDVIGNVLSQSGSYWIKATEDENHWIYPTENGKLIDAYKKSKKLPIHFYMDVGLYDAGASMLGMNRQFRDILELKGYKVNYQEFKGGHSYVNWRGTLSDGLISLIGI